MWQHELVHWSRATFSKNNWLNKIEKTVFYITTKAGIYKLQEYLQKTFGAVVGEVATVVVFDATRYEVWPWWLRVYELWKLFSKSFFWKKLEE